MKSTLVLAAAVLMWSPAAFAQEKPAADSAEKSKPGAAPAKPAATLQQLEAAFKATLNKATLTGRWCSLKDGKLGPENEDKYSIVGATKLGGSKWVINTNVEFNKQKMVVPIPVEVKWAGDTAVLIVDKLQYPGGGTYSARVLFHEHTYAGTWSGGDHGGLMTGVITNEKE